MMLMRSLALALLVFARPLYSQERSLAYRIGIAWAARGTEPACAVLEARVHTGDTVTLVWPPMDQVAGDSGFIRRAVIAGPASTCGPFHEPVVGGHVLRGELPENSAVAMAIVGPVGVPSFRRRFLAVALLGAAAQQAVRVCASMEGLHFTVWAGLPIRGRLLYHAYAYLGYDLVPNCTEEETSDPDVPSPRRRPN